MFAQAISSTTPVIAKSSMSGVLRLALHGALAARARLEHHLLRLEAAPSSASLIPFWSGASTSVMIGAITRSSPAFVASRRHPRLQPPEDVDPVVPTILEALVRPDPGSRLHRDVHERARAQRVPFEPFRRDADDRERAPVEPHRLAERVRLPGEAVHPEAVADHRDHVVRAGLVVSRLEQASERGAQPERGEVGARHPDPIADGRFVTERDAAPKIRCPATPASTVCERSRSRSIG